MQDVIDLESELSAPSVPAGPALRIAMTCYPTMGGSGVIATDLGMALAARGHQVHFICAGIPERLRPFVNQKKESQLPRLLFHEVQVEEYLLPNMGSYPLALAVRLADIARAHQLDLWHLHYGVPHAVSALLAQQLLAQDGSPHTPQVNRRAAARGQVRSIVTLHGTDVTGVGHAESLREIHRMALMSCDALTVPSRFLQRAAYDLLQLPRDLPISVIPNFVDTDVFAPAPSAADSPARPFTLCHASNFRPLKRIDDVVQVFAAVKKGTSRPVRLLLAGEGPERPRIEALVTALGLGQDVCFIGTQNTLTPTLQDSDVFLLPSQSESFGLAALEALSCGVPVIASDVGGLPEVITVARRNPPPAADKAEDHETGLLLPVGDVAGMADAVLQLIRDPDRHAAMRKAARARVLSHFRMAARVAEYEALYRRVLSR